MQLFLTFFLQEGSSGGQRALTHLRVLEKVHSSVNLEEEEEKERNFTLCNAKVGWAGMQSLKERPIPNIKSSSQHKRIPFNSFFRDPAPSCEEVGPPDHFPAKCGE